MINALDHLWTRQHFDTDSIAITFEQVNLSQWSGIPIIEIRVG